MTSLPVRVLYCHCAYAQVVPKATKDAVLAGLTAAGVPFDAVPDLCELSASKDPCLADLLAGDDAVRVAACYPRAVKWLFHAAGVPLPDGRAEVLNMRTETPEAVLAHLLATAEVPA